MEKQYWKSRGFNALVRFLRFVYPHRVIGADDVEREDGEPLVFVCNHGEIYGPVATVLFVPFRFHPWSTCEMTDREMMSRYIYENDVKRMKWLPNPVGKWAVDHVCVPFMMWVKENLGSIPVYHGDTRGLMRTFRETVSSMEKGENILLFPENSATSETGKFVREGASEFFTGFVTIGMLYHNRTGKRARFVPVYADKKRRLVSFGKSIVYDPDCRDEKQRLCAHLRGEMLRMAHVGDSAAQ